MSTQTVWKKSFGFLGAQPIVDQPFSQMVRMRVFGILTEYPDQNDHDLLRSDPVFKLLASRTAEGNDLANQRSLSRFENTIDVASLNRLQDVFLDQFITPLNTPPSLLTFDIDPFDNPTHRAQQRRFFHGYYGQYQYLPRAIRQTMIRQTMIRW